MKYSKLISVITPAYNEGKYISRSVKSILNQSYHNIELVVVNDGSTDNTLSQLKKIKDSRLKVINTKNKGRVHAKNLALRESKGEYILCQDADDWSSRERIRLLFEVSEEIGEKSVVGSNYRIFNQNSKKTRGVKLREKNRNISLKMSRKFMSSAVFPPSIMVKKEFLVNTGAWRDKFDVAAEDGDLLDRLFENGAIFHNVQKYLYNYRLNEGSITNKLNRTIPYQMFKRFCKNCRIKSKKEPNSFHEYIIIQNKNIFHSLRYYFEYFLWYLFFKLLKDH